MSQLKKLGGPVSLNEVVTGSVRLGTELVK
jgi:hypothetical protein